MHVLVSLSHRSLGLFSDLSIMCVTLKCFKLKLTLVYSILRRPVRCVRIGSFDAILQPSSIFRIKMGDIYIIMLTMYALLPEYHCFNSYIHRLNQLS